MLTIPGLKALPGRAHMIGTRVQDVTGRTSRIQWVLKLYKELFKSARVVLPGVWLILDRERGCGRWEMMGLRALPTCFHRQLSNGRRNVYGSDYTCLIPAVER